MKKIFKIIAVISFICVSTIFAVTYLVQTNFYWGATHEEPFSIDQDNVHENFGDAGMYYDTTNNLYEYKFSFTTRFIQTGRYIYVQEHPFDTLNQTFNYNTVLSTTTYPKGKNPSFLVKYDQYGKCDHRVYASAENTGAITKQLTRIHF